MTQPLTQYAKCDDIHIAYQVFGDGPIDLVLIPGFVSHIENYWDEPSFAHWLNRLGTFSRVVMFDKRGTGMSDHVIDLPSMDERMDDVRAVLDAVGIESAVIFGISEGGPMATLFAGTHPERCQSLILYGSFASFSSWFSNNEDLEALFEYIDQDWGSGSSLPMFAPSRKDDVSFQNWWGRFERLGANPSAAITLMKMNSQIDISDILPSIRVSTLVIHRTDDVTIDVDGGRYLGANIPNAKYVELAGMDHLPFVGENSEQIIDTIEEFLTGSKPIDFSDRVLATVLFTDIVNSTSQAEALGDRKWLELLKKHDNVIRKEINRFRGLEVKTLGDGFLVTFDGPARAISCAFEINEVLSSLGIEIRMGLHTGEVEFSGGDVLGIAVNISSRIANLAGSGEVLVSRTVRDLVAGSGIQFEERGSNKLSGISDKMNLYLAKRK